MAAVAVDCHLEQKSLQGLESGLKLGERGCISFKHYFAGTIPLESARTVRFVDLNPDYFSFEERREKPKIPREDRDGNTEVYGGLSLGQAREEAERCFGCGTCSHCENCYLFCPDSSVIRQETGATHVIDYDYCKGCGICANECPIGIIEMEKE
jgi:2-oxoacid:acceptor oxidoreductase delta subunit (pyruvate/2-ketoisovalerate family)